MALQMPQPTLHPKTGTYQFRRRVPADVLRLVGGPPVVKASLGTKDLREAKRRFIAMAAQFEARWDMLRRGVQDLDDEQVEAIGGEVYRDILARAGKNRGPLVGHAYGGLRAVGEMIDLSGETEGCHEQDQRLETAYGHMLARVLDARGIVTSESTWVRLLRAAHRASKQASEIVYRQVQGDWSPDPAATRFPPVSSLEARGGVTLDAAWDKWAAETQPRYNTVKRWKPLLRKFMDRLGHDDLNAVTDKDLREWVASLIKEGKKNTTVSKVHVSAVKCLMAYAKSQSMIESNPAQDLSVASGKKYARKMRGFSHEEAVGILRQCLSPPSPRMSPEFALARRWVPWICAYTGARVNEITQLRACDVMIREGIWCIMITPDAGTVKTEARIVPLHAHLVDQGLVEYCRSKKGKDPLFYKKRGKSEREATSVPPYEEMGARLSKWVRRIGPQDEELDPNHAWRHRFKSIAVSCKIPERVADVIQGHAPTTQGRRYGEVFLKDMAECVNSMPRIDC